MKKHTKKLNNSEIETNLSLSASFAEYSLDHPNIFNNVPMKASIVLVSSRYPELSEKNLSLIKNTKNTFKAIEEKNRWRLLPA